jgi:hypothetical protein
MPFSRSNWGDFNVKSQQGATKTVKRASVFLNRIQTLKPQQWNDIYKTALEYDNTGKLVDLVGNEKEDEAASEEDDLLDPLYDEIPVRN